MLSLVLIIERESRTEFLLNRKTMKMLNVMVSPSRKYIDTKFTIDKEKENDN